MDPPRHVVFSEHALGQMTRRDLTGEDIHHVIDEPESSQRVRPGRVVFQGKRPIGADGRVYLVRVFVDVDRDPPRVVTAYRTSRFARYGSQPP